MAEVIRYEDFEDILQYFDIDEEHFDMYRNVCTVEGYPIAPAGSLWTSEGVMLGCLATQLDFILETGRFRGVSTNFLIDGALLPNERQCKLTSVDIVRGGEDIRSSMLQWVDIKTMDSIKFLETTNDVYDLIWLDDCHEFDHVCKEINIIEERKLTKNILFHDYFVTNNERSKVKEAIDANRSKFKDVYVGKSEQSDCGLALGVLL